MYCLHLVLVILDKYIHIKKKYYITLNYLMKIRFDRKEENWIIYFLHIIIVYVFRFVEKKVIILGANMNKQALLLIVTVAYTLFIIFM